MVPSTSHLPTLFAVPAGTLYTDGLNNPHMSAFSIGHAPVRNRQYDAHVERYAEQPWTILRTNPITHETSILERLRNPREVIEFSERSLSKDHFTEWDGRAPLQKGSMTVFKLQKGWGYSQDPDHSVQGVSWFHAFEYCVGNGFLLPTCNQWIYAARGGDIEAPTRDREMMACFVEYDGAMWDLREWTARNPKLALPYGLRRANWSNRWRESVKLHYYRARPETCYFDAGFRVASAELPE